MIEWHAVTSKPCAGFVGAEDCEEDGGAGCPAGHAKAPSHGPEHANEN